MITKASTRVILNDGVKSLKNSLTRIGRKPINALRTILKRLRMRVRIYGLHLRLQSLLMLSRLLRHKCIKRLIDQRQWKTSQPKKSATGEDKKKAASYYQCSIKGELATQKQRLTDESWSK